MSIFFRAQTAIVLILACGISACGLATPTATPIPPQPAIDPTEVFPVQGNCQHCAEDFSTTQTIATLDPQTPIARLKWMPDDSTLALFETGRTSGPTKVTLLDPGTWTAKTVYTSDEGTYRNSFDISPDGTRFLVDNKVIDRSTGQVALEFKNDEKPYAFSPDGKWLVGAHFAKEGPADRFFIWDANTGEVHADLGLVPSDEGLFVFHPTNSSIGVHDVNGDWTSWDLATGKFLGPYDQRFRTLYPSRPDASPFLPYSPNGQWLTAVETAPDNTETIKLLDVAGGDVHAQLQDRDTSLELNGIIWSANSRTVAFLSAFYSEVGVQFWDADTGQFIRSLPLRYLQSAVLSPDGNYIIWVSNNTVRYLKVRSD